MELTSEHFESLISEDPGSLDMHLTRVDHTFVAADVKVNAHCVCLSADGNGLVQPKLLAEHLRHEAVRYAVPHSRLKEAQLRDVEHGNAIAVSRLIDEARRLFVRLEKTGEGGELLLSLLAEHHLKLPQIIAKMSLKTTSAMHYNGADGVHAKMDSDSILKLYWGESKLYGSVTDALERCFQSLKPYLVQEETQNALRTRDLELLRDHADLNNPDVQEAVRAYFNPMMSESRRVEYRGLALVGFDGMIYSGGKIDDETLRSLAADGMNTWGKSITGRAKKYGIDDVVIDLFFLPLPSAQGFRNDFLEAMGRP